MTDRTDIDTVALSDLRKRKKNRQISWENLTIWDKAALFNKWSVLAILSNIFTFFGSVCYLFPGAYDLSSTEVMIGVGCGLNWISVTRYFTHDRQYSLITRTMSKAIPIVFKIMIGILPIFIGYALLSMCLFWAYRSHLSGFSNTMYMLFSMMNGDSIMNTFQITSQQWDLLGIMFGLSFTFQAVCVWQNMSLVAVEDTYLSVKYKSSYGWIKGEVSDDGEESD